jgi:SecD/SecF fusion protein
MKSIVYILLAVFISSILITSVPANLFAGDLTIRIECIDSTASLGQLNKSAEIIQKRLKDYGIKGYSLKVRNNEKSIIISYPKPADKEAIMQLATSKGKLEFYETQNAFEYVQKIGENEPLFSILNIRSPKNQLLNMNHSCILGYVKSADKKKAEGYISTFNEEQGVKLKWGIYEKSSDTYNLYILHAKPGITGKNVAKCYSKTDQFNTSSIYITFDKEGKETWRKLTEKNIEKTIAIVYDNLVYSAPKVMDEIKTGKCLITGNFTPNEAKLISSLLNNPELPIQLEVVKF